LLQRRLTQALAKVGATAMRTDLIIHHGIADILDQATEPIYILGAVQEPRNLSPLHQWGEIPKNFE
jgi:hypothetical protein